MENIINQIYIHLYCLLIIFFGYHYQGLQQLYTLRQYFYSFCGMFDTGYWRKSSAQAIMEKAQAHCNLKDLAGNSQLLCDRYNTILDIGIKRSPTKLSKFGLYVCQSSIGNVFEKRLKMIEYLHLHPQIEEIPINSPLFIVGLPHPALSKMHHILSGAHNAQVQHVWECLSPVPNTNSENEDRLEKDKLSRFDNITYDLVNILDISRDITSLRSHDITEICECTMACSMAAPINPYTIPFFIEAFEEVLEHKVGRDFEMCKLYLQLLSWQSTPSSISSKRWVLQCPFHTPYIKDLTKVFPDSTFIWVYGDPSETVLTICNFMFELMTFLSQEPLDRRSIGQPVLKFCRLSLAKAFRDISALHKNIKIVKFPLNEFKTNPDETFANLLNKVDLTHDYLKDINASDLFNVTADLKLESYGLTLKEVDECFSPFEANFESL